MKLDARGSCAEPIFPNGQEAAFSYYGNIGDDRLEQLENLGPSSSVISEFNYQYDADGEITGWTQRNAAAHRE
ncbi:MAG: hypothetical protein ABSE62_13180 [Chthoniobacteraceae bacterium]